MSLQIQMYNVSLSSVTPEVLQAVYGYEPRLAPIEVRRAMFDPESDALLAEPHRIFSGTIDKIEAPHPTEGAGLLTVTAASASRMLTRTLTTKKSDETQRRINASDRGRDYAAVSGNVPVIWGTTSQRGNAPGTRPTVQDRIAELRAAT